MARVNDVVQYTQQESKEFPISSGVGIAGPYAVAGVDAIAAFADFSAGSGTVLIQRSGQTPRTADDDLVWVSAESLVSGDGDQQEYQSGQQAAMLYRLVVTPLSGTIKTHWVSGSRNL